MLQSLTTAIAFSSVLLSVSAADALNVKNIDSIKSWSKELASSIVNSYYKTRPTSPEGLFYNFPEYQNNSAQIGWAESASVWDALIGYSHLTGDHQFDDIIAEALYAQMGPKQDFIPEGMDKLPNDDQSQWGITALSAAEYGFPKPKAGRPTFLELAKNVFSSQVERWDVKTCAGGLRVFVTDKDSEHFSKNAHSASNFFLLGARLNKLTGVEVYAQWAERQFSWAQQSGLIGKKYEVYDIMHSKCDVEDDVSTNLNLGRWLEGCAVMMTNNKGQYDPKPWNTRLRSLLDTTKTNPNLYRMPSTPDTAPYDLIASSDQSISNTLQYARSLSHTVFWAKFAGPKLYPNITAAAIAVTEVCSPTILKTEGKENEISMACLADWRTKGPERMGQGDDKSVLAAAAALEIVQGVLWGLPEGQKPQETKKIETSKETGKSQYAKQTGKAEEPKQTAKSEDPKPTANPEDPKQSAKPGNMAQTTQAEPQPTTTAERSQSSPPPSSQLQSSQTSGKSETPSPTSSGEAKPSGDAGGLGSRTRAGWFVGMSAVLCASLMV